MKTYIYCVFDENDIPIYIGKTTDESLSTRLSSHKKRLNKNITIADIDCVDSTEWKECEKFWIEQFRQWGFYLLNKNKGGGGPMILSEEHKRKIGLANKGKKKKPLSEEHKRKLIESNLGRKASNETKQLMSQQRKGKIFSDEYRNKLSISAKQKVFTNEHKANIGKTSLGRTKSDEVKKRISEKLKGIKRKPMSDEVKEKIRQKLLLKNKK
jgi:hypothetical protein